AGADDHLVRRHRPAASRGRHRDRRPVAATAGARGGGRQAYLGSSHPARAAGALPPPSQGAAWGVSGGPARPRPRGRAREEPPRLQEWPWRDWKTMIVRLVEFALAQRLLVCTLGLVLFFGGLYAFHILDVVAYPDPSPPMVEVITQ